MQFLKYFSFVLVLATLSISCVTTEEKPLFEISFSIDPPEAGSITSNPSHRTAYEGTSYSLTAEAKEGWVFTNWGGDINSYYNPTTLTLDQDMLVVANFEEKKYTLTINVVGEGEVTEQVIALPKSTDYLPGTIVRLTANPAEDWLFQGWTEYPDSSDTIDLVITEATSISVTFKEKTFKRADNGVTIICPDAERGETGIVNGMEYTKRLYQDITDKNAAFSCTSGISDLSNIFMNKTDFNQDISHWDVSSVISMSNMFAGAIQFNQDISYWDVSSVTNMHFMFYQTEYFQQDIGKWDVSSVTDMTAMFQFSNFNQDIGDWDISNVTNMSKIFYGTSFNQDIGKWDVSSVTDMTAMFQFSNFNQDIGDWEVSSVSSMENMFKQAILFDVDIGNWDVSNVTNMSNMFYTARRFNQDIANWDVSSVTNMQSMFYYAERFNKDIGKWDVSSVTDMTAMFQFSNFNQDIGDWDVSSVNDMQYMFDNASNFNQDLTGWCVSNIITKPVGFSTESALSEENLPKWGTCPGG